MAALIDVRSSTSVRHAVMVWLNRIALAALWFIFGIAGCAGPPQPIALSVSPASAEVAAGSSTTFTAKLTSGSPLAGNVTWSVAPATGGTISSNGVYTASGTPGSYTIVATLTLVNSAPGGIFSGSAAVKVLPAPQIDAQLNPDLVQASGANQTFGPIQNSVILGQLLPSVISTDANGDIQVRSGFTPPLACRNSNTVCD